MPTPLPLPTLPPPLSSPPPPLLLLLRDGDDRFLGVFDSHPALARYIKAKIPTDVIYVTRRGSRMQRSKPLVVHDVKINQSYSGKNDYVVYRVITPDGEYLYNLNRSQRLEPA